MNNIYISLKSIQREFRNPPFSYFNKVADALYNKYLQDNNLEESKVIKKEICNFIAENKDIIFR